MQDHYFFVHFQSKRFVLCYFKFNPKSTNFTYITFKVSSPTEKTKLPSTIEINAPISLSYVTTSGDIPRTFLMCENIALFSIEKPNAEDICKMVCSSYYAFHREYPTATKNMMDFLDFVLLGKTNPNKSTKFSKFKNQFADAKSECSKLQLI